MADTRVITAHVPIELAEQLDRFATQIDRSRGWVIKKALGEWLSWEEEKNRLTLEAIEEVKKNGGIPHEEVSAYFESLIAGKPIAMPKPRKGG
jgi:predicted transcriptional regulator